MTKIVKLKLQFRNAMINISGRRALIKEYVYWVDKLTGMSERAISGSKLERYLTLELQNITESQTIRRRHLVATSFYDPYLGDKQVLYKKIEQLHGVWNRLQSLDTGRTR